MNVNDLHNNCKSVIALASQTIGTDTTTVGAIIDTENFEALEFLLASGTITDGAYTVLLEDGDDSGLSDAATVVAAQVLGSVAYALAEDDTPKRIGYVGKKRYVRLSIVSTGTTTGATLMSAMAMLAFGKHMPVANQ